jgi:hypothetical protein
MRWLLPAIFPVAGVVVGFVRNRRIDVIGAISLHQVTQHEVTALPGSHFRSSADLPVRHAMLERGDTALVAKLPTTTALRTGFDLARHLPLVDGVAQSTPSCTAER